MRCKICGTRKPRRYCPGVQGDICSICCGTEREVTVSCRLECPYLIEAHSREMPVQFDESTPNSDVALSDRFVGEHEALISALGIALKQAVSKTEGAVDLDVRETLDALTRTYRTLANGLYYDSHPVNPFADRIYREVRTSMSEYAEVVKRQGQSLREADVLGCLVFFQRISFTMNNQRPKGRWFIEFVMRQPVPDQTPPALQLIAP